MSKPTNVLPLFMSTGLIKEGTDKPVLCRLGFHEWDEVDTGRYAGFLAGTIIEYTCQRCGEIRRGQTGLGT